MDVLIAGSIAYGVGFVIFLFVSMIGYATAYESTFYKDRPEKAKWARVMFASPVWPLIIVRGIIGFFARAKRVIAEEETRVAEEARKKAEYEARRAERGW